MDSGDMNCSMASHTDPPPKHTSFESETEIETTECEIEEKCCKKPARTRLSTFACAYPGCNKTFPRKYRLQRHQRMHTSERPFICSLEGCDKSFTCINYLKKHMKRPHGVAPVVTARITKVHECKDCGKIFKHKFDLKTHSAIHGGEKQFKCNMCDASFALKGRLKKHMKRHEGYPCKEEKCDFIAESWSELLKHKSVDHKKQFKCDMCDSTFLTPANLDNHIVTHFENDFHCNFEGCDRNFQRPSNLKTHTDAVHNSEVYKCDYDGCCSVFHYKASLLRHRRMHSQPLEKKKANVGNTKCMAAYLSKYEITKEQNYKLVTGEAVELIET